MPTPEPTVYAVVDQEYMLPFEDAIALLRILAKSTPVSSNYNETVPFRLSQYKKGDHSLRVLSVAQHAAVHLEEPA